MKTVLVLGILAALATGVLKQDLVTFNPGAVVTLPNKIENKLRFLGCYKDQYDNSARTGLSPNQAKRLCKNKVLVHELEQAIEERDLDKVQELLKN